MTHLFTSKAVDIARQLVEAFPSLGIALDAVSDYPFSCGNNRQYAVMTSYPPVPVSMQRSSHEHLARCVDARLQASKKFHNLSSRCHLKANAVFGGVGEPAYLASRLSSMASQSPSRRAKAVLTEYALLSSTSESTVNWICC